VNSKAARDAAKREAAEKAYREVFQLKHTNPLDPLFNGFPDGWPGRFVGLHKIWLKKLLKYLSREKLAEEIARYQKHLTADHARLHALPDAERVKASGSAYQHSVPPALIEEFRELAHNISALEAWAADGDEAGLRALLGDRAAAVRWRIGKAVNDGGRNGGAATRKSDVERNEEQQWVQREFAAERKKNPRSRFSAMCQRVGKQHKPPRSENWVRGVLRDMQPSITGKNYRSVPLG
jgi:hypothetical protein